MGIGIMTELKTKAGRSEDLIALLRPRKPIRPGGLTRCTAVTT